MFTYLWSDAVTLVGKMVKGIPTSSIDPTMCDLVNSEMYAYWPWSWTVTSGVLCTPTDGNQDFSPAAQIYRILNARMVRTDTTPDQYIELEVMQHLAPDLAPRSYQGINAISLEEGVGLIRLSSAVQVPSGMTLEIQGEYQINPTKIAATSQGLFFPDQYLPVACEGLLYWNYKLADDPRAGGKSVDSTGRIVYTGQYAAFMGALKAMSAAEDYPADGQVFPEEGMDTGSSYNNFFGVS